MSKIKFASLEEAEAHIQKQDNELNELKISNEKAAKDLTDALATVSELGRKISLMDQHKGENQNVVEVKKEHYILLGNRFFVDGVECDAAALMLNTKELERMVKIQSGSLVKVEDPIK